MSHVTRVRLNCEDSFNVCHMCVCYLIDTFTAMSAMICQNDRSLLQKNPIKETIFCHPISHRHIHCDECHDMWAIIHMCAIIHYRFLLQKNPIKETTFCHTCAISQTHSIRKSARTCVDVCHLFFQCRFIHRVAHMSHGTHWMSRGTHLNESCPTYATHFF